VDAEWNVAAVLVGRAPLQIVRCGPRVPVLKTAKTLGINVPSAPTPLLQHRPGTFDSLPTAAAGRRWYKGQGSRRLGHLLHIVRPHDS
jgi:hypothetical protein